jgi:hypothetical protein
MEAEKPLMLYASNWYDGPISGLAVWRDEIVVFGQTSEAYQVSCAPGVRDTTDEEDAAGLPAEGIIYEGEHYFTRRYTLRRRGKRTVYDHLVGHFGWARLMNPHHNCMGTQFRPEPGVDHLVYSEWHDWHHRTMYTVQQDVDWDDDDDGTLLATLYYSEFDTARARTAMPLCVQEILNEAEREFDRSWSKWCARRATTETNSVK